MGAANAPTALKSTAFFHLAIVMKGLGVRGRASVYSWAYSCRRFASPIIVLLQGFGLARPRKAQMEVQRREREEKRLLHIIEDMPAAMMTVEPGTFRIGYANEASRALMRRIEHLLPVKADGLVGASIEALYRQPQQPWRTLVESGALPHAARIEIGPEVLDLKISAILGADGCDLGQMVIWALVTKEVEAEKRIRHLAHYDMLTGLPNRISFHDALISSLVASDARTGLLLVDLDGFKSVNDTHGHHMGDILLGQVAGRLRGICDGPGMTVGRLGGDEFAVLVQDVPELAVAAIGKRIVEALSVPYDLRDGRSIQLGATVGIALAPVHGNAADLLLTRADMALFAAKAAGTGQVLVFSPALELRVRERLRLEADLRSALETKDGLFVFYQPIVDVETGRVTTREALVRWHHPDRGWISPAQFVPIAEQRGLIEQLSMFVLQSACCEAARWPDGARVAVNISANQLGKGMLAPTILAALVRSGLSPDRLEVELTETALFGSETGCIDDLRRLRDIGVRIALDDFGTGYSSLSYLQMFRFDKVKIDGTFIRHIATRPESAAVVKFVADLGRRLDITTVVEGVETSEQLDYIRKEGCREAQGYLLGAPAPCDADAPAIERLHHAHRQSLQVLNRKTALKRRI